jgi:hypothetical protein
VSSGNNNNAHDQSDGLEVRKWERPCQVQRARTRAEFIVVTRRSGDLWASGTSAANVEAQIDACTQ